MTADAKGAAIPKVIHYCWFGHGPLPEEAEACIASWRRYCPDFEIRRWDESNFDVSQIPYVREAYAAGRWAFVSDYVRLWVIEHEGGVYLDTDVEVVASLEPLLVGMACVVCEERPGRINTGVGFAATPHHPAVRAMLEEYRDARFLTATGAYDLTACPVRNMRGMRKVGYRGAAGVLADVDCMVLPAEVMSPVDPETGELHMTERTVSIHHFSASWKTDDEKRDYASKQALRRRFGRFGVLLYHASVFVRAVRRDGMGAALDRVRIWLAGRLRK